MEHTKIEWQTVFRNETGWDYKTQREKQIRMVYIDDVGVGEIVCRIFGHPEAKVQEDRARLIAAAPDLLEVCKEVEGWMRSNIVAINRPAKLDKLLMTAIAKAEKQV